LLASAVFTALKLRRRRDSNSRYLSICHLSKVVE
jgi:hypothetical protein